MTMMTNVKAIYEEGVLRLT